VEVAVDVPEMLVQLQIRLILVLGKLHNVRIKAAN
jgi:hypothetical protein